MPTASMFDDPMRERGRLGSTIGGMAGNTQAPTERVANACLVTDAQEPNAITRMRDDDTRALMIGSGPQGPMVDLPRADLILTFKKDAKMCASCDRGSHLQFRFDGSQRWHYWFAWRRCRRHLTK